QKPDRGTVNDRPLIFTQQPERTMSKEEMRKERDTRDAEITRMLQPRDASASVASRLDPVSSPADSRRPEVNANPVGGRRTDSFLNTSRPATAVGGISGVGNTPIFSGGSDGTRPGGLPSASGFDFGPRTSSSAGSAFGGSSVSTPIAA